MNDVSRHYDALIDENNDPVHDPKPLKEYMEKWDGSRFLESMNLDKNKTWCWKSGLEPGVLR